LVFDLIKRLGTYRGHNTKIYRRTTKNITPEQLHRLSDYAVYDLLNGDEFVRIWKIFGDPVLDEDLEI